MVRSSKPSAETLDLTLRADDLSTTYAELQMVHVPPSGIISFPNRSEFEVTHLPGSTDVLSTSRRVSIDLTVLRQRFGDQAGHLYGIIVHSQPRPLVFKNMTLEIRRPGVAAAVRPLTLADHAALLGVWWQDRAGEWDFEYSGQVLDTLNGTYQSIYLLGRYAERFAER
ncbi:hypothetical protein [Deinococcus sonorensis]|uniref:Uncharacterized protein n=2 Tax=Deinococcus sonorensis TaxID=309891 RepID=A0AAU7UD76_9DEIO